MIPSNQFWFNSGSVSSLPLGDLMVETFNPQVGSYTDNGVFTRTITPGNMALSGGNGFFSKYTTISNVVWNGNNWYHECEYELTSSNNNDWGVVFGLQSITGIQPQSIYWGLYYFNANNSTAISLFGQNAGLGQIAPESPSLVATVGDRIKVRADFVEGTITITATNMTNPNSVSLVFNFNYTTAVNPNQIKPNTVRLAIIPSGNVTNIKSYKFGSLYVSKVDGAFLGDSITRGYFGGSTTNRYQNLYAAQTNKTIATFAGAGDRSIELSNIIALNYYVQFLPKKVHILIGTNDIANGIALVTTQNNINTIISAFQAIGSTIFIGTLLPRNGQNNLTLNAFINGLSGVTVIDYYTNMESSPGSGNINPTYSDDNIHPNATGMIFMKNLLVAAGF